MSAPVLAPTFTFSPQQETLFNWAASGRGSAVLVAVAGSGKTSTIKELCRRLPRAQYIVYIAFNKRVVDDVKQALPEHVRVFTFNGAGFSTWLRHLGKQAKVEVSVNKTRDIMRAILLPDELETFGNILPKLVALGKGAGIVPECTKARNPKLIALTRDSDEVWQALMEHYDVDTDDQLGAIALARKVLDHSIAVGNTVIDFDDQLYLPIIHGARFFQNDWVLVDESQDVNKLQRAMLKRMLRPGGRLLAVGDPAQAIYGFRGADTTSISSIKREFGAVELPLTFSFRCPKAVVREAQQYVSHIQTTESAPEGEVLFLDKTSPTDFGPADAILCRNSAPLVDMAFKLMRNRVACKVLGRELGVGLENLIKKMKAKGVDNLMLRLSEYNLRESAKFIAKGEEQKADALADRIATVVAFVENLPETNRTIPALLESISSLFTDNGAGMLTLCTVHKSKGGEWNKVFILDAFLMPSKYARQEWQQEQERNLQYVAVTRAKQTLCYMETEGFRG